LKLELPSLVFPGPGTAALFGAALVFIAMLWSAKDFSEAQRSTIINASIVGGFLLLFIGLLIEHKHLPEFIKRRCMKMTNAVSAAELEYVVNYVCQ